jgi:hypothetical protein
LPGALLRGAGPHQHHNVFRSFRPCLACPYVPSAYSNFERALPPETQGASSISSTLNGLFLVVTAIFATFTSHGNCTSTSVATTFHWVLLLSSLILRARPSRPPTLCPPCLAWLVVLVKPARTRPPCLACLTFRLQSESPPYHAHNTHPSAPSGSHLTLPIVLPPTLQARSMVLCTGCRAFPRHAGIPCAVPRLSCVSPRPTA